MEAADAQPVAELTTQLGYAVGAGEIAQRFADLRDRTDDEVLVATDDDGAVAGWIHVSRMAILEAGDLAAIMGLVVGEGRRSSGIGASLVAAAEAWARGRGATAIMVRSRSTRRRAHRFYERIGYVEIKRSHVFEKPLV